jgi:hypothetical protein
MAIAMLPTSSSLKRRHHRSMIPVSPSPLPEEEHVGIVQKHGGPLRRLELLMSMDTPENTAWIKRFKPNTERIA